jgi:hypothetical protein
MLVPVPAMVFQASVCWRHHLFALLGESKCNGMAKSVELGSAHLTAVFCRRKAAGRVRRQRVEGCPS